MYEELTPEHKQKFDEIKALFEADLIGSFERTRHHSIRWKGFSPEGALDGVDLSLSSEERTRALCQEVNYMVAHSLHQHSESLVNAFDHEESVLSNRTHPGESQGGIAVSNQATTALCIHGSRITRCTSVCRVQGGRRPRGLPVFQ
jgi:hypothetical protein